MTGTISGALSGAFAASGLNAVGVSIADAAINAGETILSDYVDGELSAMTAVSAVAAVVIGSRVEGPNPKHGMLNKGGSLFDDANLYKKAMPKNNLRPNRKYVNKQFRRTSTYFKHAVSKEMKAYAKDTAKTSIREEFYNSVFSDIIDPFGNSHQLHSPSYNTGLAMN